MSLFRFPIWLSIALSVWLYCFTTTQALSASNIIVFAASSTQPVIDDLTLKLRNQGINIQAVYASSATLAKQIQNGAEADVFISANTKWMDVLDKQSLIAPKTRTDIATNRLALIAHRDFNNIDPNRSILQNLGTERLAIADTKSVPAGIYAKQALISTHQWEALKDHLAPAKDVSSALMFVARGETPLGIVYASDIKRTNNVRKIYLFKKKTHDVIRYQAAIVRNKATQPVKYFLSFLIKPISQSVFMIAGFGGKP